MLRLCLICQECVAEYTRRPLLPLTPGDIGTDPVTVDKSLAKYFKLGESWGAIVLLDEADVYLEARNLHDLERNSLVSGKVSQFSCLVVRLAYLLLNISLSSRYGILSRVRLQGQISCKHELTCLCRILFLTTNRGTQ